MKFEELKLRPELLSGLEKLKFENCTSIQEAVIPLILDGKDISGLSQTGTGKTAAFLLPLMERILCSKMSLEGLSEEEVAFFQKRAFPDWKKNNFVLILVPTRELAEQVYQDIQRFRGDSSLDGVALYGGSSYDPQKTKLAQGVEFIVGTPGRLIDLYKTHAVDLRQVQAVVFDEADRMFDMGFKDDMKYLLQRIPKTRQFLVFSATLNFEVLHTAYHFGADPIEFNVSRDQAKAENVKDFIFHLGQQEKPKYLLSILKKHNPKQTIIFTNFKFNVERVARFLTENGWPAVAISSLLTQSQRNRVLDQFKAENDQNILVATDLAARGLDIKGVDLVINFDLPDDAENYVHRIGRTGRAGATGTAYSMVGDRDVEALVRIEEYLKHKVEAGWFEDSELVTEFKPFPSEDRGGRKGPPHKSGGPRREGRPNRRPHEGRRGHRDSRPPRAENGPDSRPQTRTDSRPEARQDDRQRSQPAARAEGGSQHRDRRTGRHSGSTPRTESSTNGRPQQQKQNAQQPQHRNPRSGGQQHQRKYSREGAPAAQNNPGQRRPYKSQGPRRPGTSNASSDAGLISKVSAFLKRLVN